MSKEHAINEAEKQGAINITNIIQLPENPPTKAQLNYAKALNIIIPENTTRSEVSDILSMVEDDDHPADESLMRFALRRNIEFTKYTGMNNLRDTIKYFLPRTDKYAFLCFEVYRKIFNYRYYDMDNCKHRNVFYQFSNDYKDNKEFVKSYDLNFYNTATFTQTKAYRFAKYYLKKLFC